MKEKMTEKNILEDVPYLCAQLKCIEYLFNAKNVNFLRAKTIDKFCRESYRIHGLIVDVEDEMFFNERMHPATYLSKPLSEEDAKVLNEAVNTIFRRMTGG